LEIRLEWPSLRRLVGGDGAPASASEVFAARNFGLAQARWTGRAAAQAFVYLRQRKVFIYC